jgi:hypothetical protein
MSKLSNKFNVDIICVIENNYLQGIYKCSNKMQSYDQPCITTYTTTVAKYLK